MTPLPPPLGSGDVRFWRLDQEKFATSWAGGEGSWLVGGRWSSRGVRAIYASIDPSTAILEVAVHKTFRALDLVPHVLTSAKLRESRNVRILLPDDVPDPAWLSPGVPSAAQQAFGDALLRDNAFILAPSVVSAHSWNVIFSLEKSEGIYDDVRQEKFVLDPRLHGRA